MGGMRSFWGPLLGAAMFVVLQDYISSMTVNWMSFVGLIFVLVVLFFPRGLLGMLPAAECGMTMLEVRNVTKQFGNLVAVSDVSMQVAAGELRAIIGPNGAGKTTFFNMICGFFAPTSGDILFDGQDMTQVAAHRRVGRGMARTFQITEIFPELTVRENVRIAAEVARRAIRLRIWLGRADAARRRQRRSSEMLTLVGLDGQGRPAGRRARPWRPARGRDRHGAGAEAAAAAARRADRGHGRPGDLRRSRSLIRRLHRDSSYTIVLIEHDMRVVFNLADRITVLDQGTLLAEGTPEEIAANRRPCRQPIWGSR